MTLHDERIGPAERLDPRNGLRGLLETILGLLAAFWSKFAPLIGAVSIIGFFAVMFAIDWLRPVNSWDILAYLGVVARDWLGMTSAADIQAYAYDTVRVAIDPHQYELLTGLDAYRERMAADPDAFVSMLGMYDVKWLYVALLALLGPVFGAFEAGFAINLFAGVVISTGLIWWLRETRMLDLGVVAPALLMIVGLPGIAMVNVPDFLAFSLTVTGILLLDRDRVMAGLILLFLAVLVRPDMIAFLGVLMAVAWFWRDSMTAKSASAFLGALVAFLAVEAVSTNPGWWTHLWFSTYRMESSLDGFDPDFSLRVYMTAFVWNLVRSAIEDAWLGLFAVALLAWGVMQGADVRLTSRRAVLVSAALTGIAAKFVVFPIHDGRFYIPLLFPALLILMAGARDHFRAVRAKA